ncbi:UbiA family prenyltransferase [Streptomyces sp. XM4193]|uniref:UbiA family prenyltransferase n=1 Tax=Streptomyces sp. XM4193 TaxID=2929782 RepID=UPI001FFAF91B|nr:UbiA family prenyltransferase [Streptomyces sp. XM4193]MCK1795201.1 UbiA family prenyltransferase [Streptomyces sp. XM4193]
MDPHPLHPRPPAPTVGQPTAGARRSGVLPLALLRCSHPGAVLAVTVLTTVLAATGGHPVGSAALVGAAVLSGQLSVGWSNDARDAARDTAAERADKPVAVGDITARTLWTAAVAALAVCAVLSLACGTLAGTVHLLGVAGAWAYNLRLKSTVLSWLPYAVGFAALPAFVALAAPGGTTPAWWAVAAGALLGVAAHLADVLPDLRQDLAAGVRGLPQRLGARTTRALLPLPLVAATAVLVVGPPDVPGLAVALAPPAAVALALGGLALGRRVRHAPFVGAVGVAVLAVGLLVASGAGTG